MNQAAESISPVPGRSAGSRATPVGDTFFHGLTAVAAVLVLAIIAGIAVSLILGSAPALAEFGPGFLVSDVWNPVTNNFGAYVAIFGTLVTSAIAMVIAVPVSFGVALFISELAPAWLKRPISVAIELLAAVPSIIYGMWGLFVLAPVMADTIQPWLKTIFGDIPLLGVLVQGPPIGIGVFTAGVILAIMVIPFIASVMRDTFEVVPKVLKESAYATGATTWEVVRHIVLPYTRTGVVGGIMLGLGRALGETMAVTFVIGNSHNIHAGLFHPGNSIAATLANEFTEATGEIYTSALLALGLILFGITLIVLIAARLLLMRLQAGEGR
ncbi:phosphate ABC transporter permease subunit PstC [Salinisphaera orenii]|uniref:phosphate ABC transporter permease subunit PstC n=1 Tax=Salinisphaera orenii TaxID=856731 RepID=UPI0019550951